MDAQPGWKILFIASLDKMAAAAMIFSECVITTTMINWVRVALAVNNDHQQWFGQYNDDNDDSNGDNMMVILMVIK